MKFEKFLKSVGTHGKVVSLNESEKWLVCDGVGMVIPRGVDNLLGRDAAQDDSIVRTLAYAENDELLELTKAVILEPAGNAKAIIRVFESTLGSTVGICNADYGFLEKKDRLGYCEVEIPETEDKAAETEKFIVVFDNSDHVVGFINGLKERTI